MHTSREARQEGKRYYELWTEKCPQEGKNTFRAWSNLWDVQIRPTENIKNARPEFNNKIWVNPAIDRFVFHDMKGHYNNIMMSFSLGDYNFYLDNMLKIRHGRYEADTKLGFPRRTGALEPLPGIQGLKTAVFLTTNWKYIAIAEIQEVRDQPEETLATHLAFKTFVDMISQRWKEEKRSGIRNYLRTVSFKLEEDIDLPPCPALLP
jgi:hypothetical protein